MMYDWPRKCFHCKLESGWVFGYVHEYSLWRPASQKWITIWAHPVCAEWMRLSDFHWQIKPAHPLSDQQRGNDDE